MKQFGIDYQVLDKQINKKSFLLSQVKDKIKKVAFDVVKFNDDAIEGLWKIEHSPDGEVIVALYDDSIQKSASVQTDWTVIASSNKNDLAFFYKNEPVAQLPVQSLGLISQEIDQVLKWLPEKLATNQNLRKNILKMANNYQLSFKFPELFEVK